MLKQVFLVVLALHCILGDTSLQSALQSPQLMFSLFNKFKITEHRRYAGRGENKMRYRLFRAAVAEIAAINTAQQSYRAGINFMADLTTEEREQYYGLNLTDYHDRTTFGKQEKIPSVLPDDITEVDWTARNKVAHVKDQKKCGSCWSFGGTGALESRYAVATGALKALSEQQGLDCSYEERKYRDGCRGGWPRDVWKYIIKSKHYALEEDYPYEAKDLKCRTHGKKSALSHAVLQSYLSLDKGDEHLIQALRSGAVSVAFKVKSGFSYYKKGIYKDPGCPQTSPSHAVLATGYAKDYIIVKNSWGLGWGDKGYIKFARIGNMCGISGYAAVPVLGSVREEDDPKCADKHRECGKWAEHCGQGSHWKYMATKCPKTCNMCRCDMSGCTLCVDALKDCGSWANEGYCSKPNYQDFMKYYCPVACNKCSKDEDGDEDGDDDGDKRCGNGLVWCHGECRHQHFC